jgi:protein-S-isoprenylcysteine O-methyltransferase Ste14
MKMEEKSLLERYGQAYSEYQAKVKRIFPYVY